MIRQFGSWALHRFVFLLLFFLLGELEAASRSPVWRAEEDILHCQHIFRPSKREISRHGQQDPFLLWIGRPSRSLQVEGRHGPLPMPSVWASFVNILYITKCQEWSRENLVQFMHEWFVRNEKMRNREIYIAGNTEDEEGGVHLLNIADEMHRVFNISGVVAANAKFTPVMRFVGHRSFETMNNMTFWTINRAKQDIVCNGLFSEVEFLMHDIVLQYHPKISALTKTSDKSTNFEYELVSVSSTNKRYCDLTNFEEELSSRRLHKDTIVCPRVRNSDSNLTEIFPKCGKKSTLGSFVDQNIVEKLLDEGVRVVLYNYLQKLSQATCNFYIGIYQSDSSYIEIEDNENYFQRNVVERFNEAILEEMSSVWSSDSSSDGNIMAWIQDGVAANDKDKDDNSYKGGLVWIQIDERFVPEVIEQGGLRKPALGFLTRGTAVEILSHLLGKHSYSQDAYDGSVVDFVDLLI